MEGRLAPWLAHNQSVCHQVPRRIDVAGEHRPPWRVSLEMHPWRSLRAGGVAAMRLPRRRGHGAIAAGSTATPGPAREG